MNRPLSSSLTRSLSAGLIVPIGFVAPEDSIPLNALIDENGQPVVDENGNPILTS
jgi:hypothetical protein